MPSLNQLLALKEILPIVLFIVVGITGVYFSFRTISDEFRYQKQFGHLPEFMRPTKSYWRRHM
ncbi:hypothetical protein M2444_005610 [Paenibacillus sp. PastF-3]|nr:hypothetical protein [Paenibacillus sp. PastF-3]